MKYVFSVFIFMGFSLAAFSQESVETCVELVMKKTQDSTHFVTDFFEMQECPLGKSVPDFRYKPMGGDSSSSSSFKGKILVLNFWFIGCHPCLAEMPGLNKLVKNYDSGDVVFLAITWENEVRIREDFLSAHKLDFTIIPDALSIIQKIMAFGYPTTYIIDREGIIRAVWSGGRTDEKAPEEFFKRADKELKKILKND